MEKTQDGKPTQQGEQEAKGATPKAESAGTQKKESKVYKPDEVQALLADQATRFNADIKALKDSKADEGRMKKTISELQSEVDELRGVKDDPDLSAVARQKAKDEISKLKKQIDETKGELFTLQSTKETLAVERSFKAIAEKHEVDPEALKKLIEDKTGTPASGCSEKLINFFAESLSEAKAAEKDTGYKPDSGVGGGGGKVRLSDLPFEERTKELDRLIREGKTK